MLDEESRQNIINKKQRLGNKLNKGKKHYMALLELYLNETFKGMEEMYLQCVYTGVRKIETM